MLKDRIQALCTRRGISISKLEKECDIGHGTILKWDTASPTLAKLRKVAKYFGISVCELIGEDDE